LLLSVPTYRVDVTREADVIEEILRIYGYNQIDIPEKLNASLSYSKGISDEAMRNLIADMLASNGFVEMMSNSLSSSANHLKMKSALLQPELNVAMLNPLSSELDILRRTLAVNMLEAVAFNQNRKNADLRLFEMGKVYQKAEKGYRENLRLALLMTGSRYSESWNNPKEKVSYFDLRNEVDLILQRLGLSEEAKFNEIQSDWYEDGQSIIIRNKKLGELGWIKPTIANGFGVDEKVFMAEIDWEVLFSVLGSGKIKFAPIPKFPTVRRDFSLLLDASVQFDAIEKLARKAEKKLLVDVGLFDVYEGKNLSPGKKSYAVRFLLRDNDKTLTDAEVDKVMGNIRQKLETELGASLR
jgi:phenylalanyl-tRNA synthetase beta chain